MVTGRPPGLLSASWAPYRGCTCVRQTRMGVELYTGITGASWVLMGALDWVAAFVVPVQVLSSCSLIAPGTPWKSVSPPFSFCCERLSLASGYLVEVGLQSRIARVQGLDWKVRVTCIAPLTVTLPPASRCWWLLTENSGLMCQAPPPTPHLPPASPLQPEVLRSRSPKG